jgi:putative ABC transport system permease protein
LVFRRVRSVLTALAIVLGVAMVSGTYILTDTMAKAFDDIFAGSYSNSSAIISGRQVVKESTSGNATVSESVLRRAAAAPGVADATGAIFDLNGTANIAKILDENGEVITSGGAPTFGFGFPRDAAGANPLRLTDGAFAAGPGEVVIDKETANDQKLEVGESVPISAQGPVRRYRISGIARYGTVDSLGGATIAAFDLPTAQRLFGKRGEVDVVFLAAREGVSQEQLVREVRPLLPPTAQVKTAEAQAASNSEDIQEVTRFIQYFLLAFGAIALFVGAFVIVNTLNITVAQRVREFATLRTLGASRRQVLRSVLLEGLAIGVIASVAGLVLGVGLARGLDAVFKAFDLSLPEGDTVFKGRTVIVSLALGIGITVLATISPALRATRVPPIAAVREGATLPRSGLARRSGRLGTALLVVAAGLLVWASFGGLEIESALLVLLAGCLVLFVAFGLLASRLVRPLAATLGHPGERFAGAIGRLARQNSTRNPGRTATTAAALMIGLALVTLVATLGNGLRNSTRDSLERQVVADYVISSEEGFEPFTAAAGAAAARAPGVTGVSNVRSDDAQAFGEKIGVVGIDTAIGDAYRYRLAEGSAAADRLPGDGAIVEKGYADKHDLRLGSTFALQTPAGGRLTIRVAAIEERRSADKLSPVLDKVAVAQSTFDRAFPRPKNIYSFVGTGGGASAATTAALERALAPFPDAVVRTKAAWVDNQASGIDTLLNLLYVLLALSVLVSLFGMVNTLVLSVFERTREIGMLRAVGMTRRQVRGMVRQESVITALIGAAMGLPLGVLVAALISQVLADEGIGFSLPVGLLVVFTIVALIAGLVAAIFPARRASQLDVLEALQYE